MDTQTVLFGFLPPIGYIDPGTGSLILQLLLGGIASAWVVLKLFGRRIREWVKNLKKQAPDE
jgi:hypothetical protein